MTFKLTIEPLSHSVDVQEKQTLLDAALRNGIYLPHACLHGLCGTCKNFDIKTSFCKLHKRKVTKLDSCQLYNPTQEPLLSITYGKQE